MIEIILKDQINVQWPRSLQLRKVVHRQHNNSKHQKNNTYFLVFHLSVSYPPTWVTEQLHLFGKISKDEENWTLDLSRDSSNSKLL